METKNKKSLTILETPTNEAVQKRIKKIDYKPDCILITMVINDRGVSGTIRKASITYLSVDGHIAQDVSLIDLSKYDEDTGMVIVNIPNVKEIISFYPGSSKLWHEKTPQ